MPAHLIGLVVSGTVVTLAWAWSLTVRNADVIDRLWGITVTALGWTYVAVGPEVTPRSVLAAGLATVWGLRLAGYLWLRDRHRGESWRYRKLRARAPRTFWLRSLFGLFWLQAVAAVAVALPLLAVVRAGQPAQLGWLDAVGVGLWTVGFSFEVVGDQQLHRFRTRPTAGDADVLDTGLWRYTRHPNYFGDALLWWGLGAMGLAAGAWWALLGPAGMTLVLLRVSGVAAIEPHLHETRGDAYATYAIATSSFLPLPPRSPSGHADTHELGPSTHERPPGVGRPFVRRRDRVGGGSRSGRSRPD